MRVRRIARKKKEIQTDTGWQTSDVQPKHHPLFTKTKPIRAGWKWRSAKIEGDGKSFVLFAECNVGRDNWKSALISVSDEMGNSAIARFEHHGSHPGLHIHSHCERSGIESGASSLDDLVRIPDSSPSTYHRRKHAWTENGFWEASKKFFSISEKSGSLI